MSPAGPAHGVQRAVETMEDLPTPGIKLAAGGGGGGGATASKKKSKRAPPSVKVPPRSVVAAKQGNNMSIAEEVKAKADRWTALVNCANEITTVACCPAGGGQGEGSQSASASLWLCSFVTACDAAFIQAERIGCIVTVGVGMKSELVSVAERHTLHVLDELHEDLTPHLDSTAELIGRNLDAGRSVVVHCECGISRSPTVVAAFLVHRGLAADAEDAVSMVKAARSCICPNAAFMGQLRDWADARTSS